MSTVRTSCHTGRAYVPYHFQNSINFSLVRKHEFHENLPITFKVILQQTNKTPVIASTPAGPAHYKVWFEPPT